MEDSRYDVVHRGTTLNFVGCSLDGGKHEEKPEDLEFGDYWFHDELGNRIEIEVHEDTRHPHDNSDQTLFARVVIEGQVVQTLEIFEHSNGTSYLVTNDASA